MSNTVNVVQILGHRYAQRGKEGERERIGDEGFELWEEQGIHESSRFGITDVLVYHLLARWPHTAHEYCTLYNM